MNDIAEFYMAFSIFCASFPGRDGDPLFTTFKDVAEHVATYS